MGPVASFAGDAQTLSQALGAGDNAGARRATASLDADAASVDAALKAHSGAIKPAIKPDRWDALKHELAAIEKSVPPAPASAAPPLSSPPPASGEPASASAAAPGAAVMSAPAADSAAAASAPAPAAADSGGPTIKIESRSVVGDVTHLKGYFEGSALQAAGIYEGAQSVKPIKVDHVTRASEGRIPTFAARRRYCDQPARHRPGWARGDRVGLRRGLDGDGKHRHGIGSRGRPRRRFDLWQQHRRDSERERTGVRAGRRRPRRTGGIGAGRG